MNKSELIKAIAEKSNLSQTEINKAIDAFCEVIGEAMAQDEEVALTGFGTFKVTDRAARDGRNPKTGEPIKIAATRSPKFTPGKTLKDKAAASKAKKSK